MATRMTLVMLLTSATAGLLVAETTIKNEVKITPADAQALGGRVVAGEPHLHPV